MTEPFLTVQGTPIYFQEDWDAGIGGGLWSTSLALARYFDSPHAREQFTNSNDSLSILELGSGNGLLALCLLALFRDRVDKLVVTDLDDEHMQLIQRRSTLTLIYLNLHKQSSMPGANLTTILY